jgi:hypothetical protein
MKQFQEKCVAVFRPGLLKTNGCRAGLKTARPEATLLNAVGFRPLTIRVEGTLHPDRLLFVDLKIDAAA